MPQLDPPAADPQQSVEAALETLRRATHARPAQPLAFLELGDLLGRLGRFNEAAQVFEAGLALEPRAIILRVGLGYLNLARNDRAAARAEFLAVRAAAPERYDGMVGLANVMALDGEHAAAVDLYHRALELQPDNAVTRIALARALLDMGDRDAGEAELRRVAAAAPDNVGPAIRALAAGPHGRAFLDPAAAAAFLKTDPASRRKTP